MNYRHYSFYAALILMPMLGGCQSETMSTETENAASASANGMPQTFIGKAARQAIEEAREELARADINLNNEFDHGGNHGRVIAKVGNKDPDDPRPDAQLTPQGELLLDGRKVETTPAQHAMLMQYRQQIMDVAETGMALGVQGADLGGKAIGAVFDGLLSGEPSQIDARIQPEADKLEANVMRLCRQLPALRETQQALAAALPEFEPYATMTAEDIDDCRSDVVITEGTDEAARRHEVRDSIRSTIRRSIRGAAQAAGLAEGGTPDTVEPAADEATTQ